MKKNMGNIDRILRMLIAAIVVVLYLMNIVSATLAIVLLIASGIFLLTSFIGFCPLYTIAGFNTCKSKKE